MTTWVEIVTGQNNLNYIQNKIYPMLSPLCRFCEEEEETFFHFLTDCPVFNEKRSEILLSRDVKPEDWKMYQIIKLAKVNDIKNALSFDQPQFQ